MSGKYDPKKCRGGLPGRWNPGNLAANGCRCLCLNSRQKREQKSSKLNIHDYPLPWDRMYDKDERGEQLIHAGLPANRAVFPSGGDKRLPGLAEQHFQCKQDLRKR